MSLAVEVGVDTLRASRPIHVPLTSAPAIVRRLTAEESLRLDITPSSIDPNGGLWVILRLGTDIKSKGDPS